MYPQKKLIIFLDFIILNLTLSIGLVEFKTIKYYILKTTERNTSYILLKNYTYSTSCYMCMCC